MSEPRRLHPAAVILLAIRVARELAIPILIPIGLQIFRGGFSLSGVALWIVPGIVLFLFVSAIFGVVSWRRYTYRVEDDELRVEQGIINRSKRYIPVERIQAVDVVQGVLQRLFGVVSLRVETAGGGGGRPEVSLMAVSRSDALELQQALSLRVGQALDAPEEAESQVLRSLSAGDLILAGSTAGRLGIALPLVFSAMTFADDIIPYHRIFGTFDRLPGVSILVALGFALLLFAWVLGLAGTILAHAGFRLSRIGDNLLIERGLLERRRATIPVGRIQAVRIVEGPTRQLLGLVELRVESAAHGRSAGESTVLFPLLRRGDVLLLLQDAVPELATEPSLARLPARARRRYVSRLLLPTLVVSVPFAILLFPLGLLALALVPFAILLGLRQYADAGWALDPTRLVVRGRVLDRTTAIVPRRRIQFMNLASNPFQRRAQLATLGVHVASGLSGRGFQLLHLDAGQAGRLLAWFRSPQDGVKRSNEPRISPDTSERLRPLADGPQGVRIQRPDER